MEGIHRISNANTGSVLKQGDTTELKFKLYDANDDNIDHILNKPAEVVFLKNGDVYYRTEGNVDDFYMCTFTIDEVLPTGMYHIEFIVESGIYPSGDSPYFTIAPSSRGKDSVVIQTYGFEDLVVRTTEEVGKRLEGTVTEVKEAELDRHAQEEAREVAERERVEAESTRELNEQNRLNKDRLRDDKIAQMKEDVSGLNNYSTISTYTNGKLTKIEEKDGLVSKKITILAYEADGKLKSVKESRQGGGTETHLSYEGGGVSTSKTSWVAKTYVLKGSDVFLLETAGTETDYASFHIPEDAVAGTQGVDYVARLYKTDGTEIREIPSTQRTTAEGIGGFYWSTTRVSLVFEKDKYASLEEAKAALAGLVLQYKIK